MSNNNQDPKNNPADLMREIFGEPIHTYTRAQAIADGVLVDLMQGDLAEICRRYYKLPIACTAAVDALITVAIKDKFAGMDYAGILTEILHMSRVYGDLRPKSSVVDFRIAIRGTGRRRYHDFKLHIGPGDNMEPVITLMMFNED